jgi:hypothetical protein
MEPFDVYKLYLALKLHFTTWSYDIAKHKGAVKGKKETFLRRKDLMSVRKIARDFTKQQVIDFLVANFVSGDRWGGMFDTSAMDVYKEWDSKKDRLLYNFEADLHKIIFRMESDKLKSAVEGQHPLILRMLLGKDINLETVVLLEKINPFVMEYKDDFVLGDTVMLIIKYKLFVKTNLDKLNKFSDKINEIFNT